MSATPHDPGLMSTNGRPMVRIFTVGRGDAGAALRRDERFERHVAKTALTVVGDLWLSVQTNEPGERVVLVSPDADPAHDAARWIAALRSVDPRVRVYRLGPVLGQTPVSTAYDGVVEAHADGESLLALMRGGSGPKNGSGHAVMHAGWQDAPGAAGAPGAGSAKPPVTIVKPVVPTPKSGSVTIPLPMDLLSKHDAPTELLRAPGSAAPAAKAPAPTSTSLTPSTSPPSHPATSQPSAGAAASARLSASPAPSGDDSVMVQALLGGRDVVRAGVDLIRARLGRAEVLYQPATPGDGPGPAAGAAAVQHREHTFGYLVCAGSAVSDLATQGRWLGGWLALARQQDELRQAALVDELTGAWNRRYFKRYLRASVEQARQSRQTLTLLVFDIDNFKKFNDQFGHAAGDEILKHAVGLLQATIRTSDRVCRIGGDEFAVIFWEPAGPRDPGSKPPEAVHQIAQRFQKLIEQSRFPKLGRDAPGMLSVSGGLATYPWDGRTPDELLSHADALAMQSKRSGKAQIVLGPQAEPGPGGPELR